MNNVNDFIIVVRVKSSYHADRKNFESSVIDGASELQHKPVEINFLGYDAGHALSELKFHINANTQFTAAQTANEIAEELQTSLNKKDVTVSYFNAVPR